MWIGTSSGPLPYKVFCFSGSRYEWGYLYRAEANTPHHTHVKWLVIPGLLAGWHFALESMIVGDRERERADAIPVSSLPLWQSKGNSVQGEASNPGG